MFLCYSGDRRNQFLKNLLFMLAFTATTLIHVEWFSKAVALTSPSSSSTESVLRAASSVSPPGSSSLHLGIYGAPLPPSPPGNLELAADRLEVDTRGQSAILTGRVSLKKGSDLALKCSRLEVRYDAQGPKVVWARGSGGITADVKGIHGESGEFELDLVKHMLILQGGARLSRGDGWLVADGATVDLQTARLSMTQVKASLPVGNALKR